MKGNTIAIVAGLAVAAFIAKLAYDERKAIRNQDNKAEPESKSSVAFRVPDDFKGNQGQNEKEK